MEVLQVYNNKVLEALLPDWSIYQYPLISSNHQILTRYGRNKKWLSLRNYDRRPAPE